MNLPKSIPNLPKPNTSRALTHTRLAFTTNPGLERFAWDEFLDQIVAAGLDRHAIARLYTPHAGQLLFEAPYPWEQLRPLVLPLRTPHHILHIHHIDTLQANPALPEICELVTQHTNLGALRNRGASFRVTAHRKGKHDFDRMAIQRTVGAAVVTATKASVSLKQYDFDLRLDLQDTHLQVAQQITKTPLSQRFERTYVQRVAVRPNVAHVALRLALVNRQTKRIVDPFCGSGTILLEAGTCFPQLELWGSDSNPEAVQGTRQNLALANLEGRAKLFVHDARHIHEIYPHESFDAIVTNPPYGVQLGRNLDFRNFYRNFLDNCHGLLKPGGRLIALVRKRGAFNRALSQTPGLVVRYVRVVDTGGVFPAYFVVERSET